MEQMWCRGMEQSRLQSTMNESQVVQNVRFDSIELIKLSTI